MALASSQARASARKAASSGVSSKSTGPRLEHVLVRRRCVPFEDDDLMDLAASPMPEPLAVEPLRPLGAAQSEICTSARSARIGAISVSATARCAGWST